MPSDHITFAGVELTPGRKPVIFVVLGDELSVEVMENWTIDEALACLKEYQNLWLCINLHSVQHEQTLCAEFRKKIKRAGFKSFSVKGSASRWMETSAQDCFRALIGQTPLPRRTLEGRLQRSAILYEQGLQLRDPVEIFEEFTRFKLVQGILPLEDIYSSRELDALVAAYVAWLAANSPGQIAAQGDFVLPARE